MSRSKINISRRKFIKKAGLYSAGGSILLSNSNIIKAQTPNKQENQDEKKTTESPKQMTKRKLGATVF